MSISTRQLLITRSLWPIICDTTREMRLRLIISLACIQPSIKKYKCHILCQMAAQWLLFIFQITRLQMKCWSVANNKRKTGAIQFELTNWDLQSAYVTWFKFIFGVRLNEIPRHRNRTNPQIKLKMVSIVSTFHALKPCLTHHSQRERLN